MTYDPLAEDSRKPDHSQELFNAVAAVARSRPGFVLLLHIFSALNYLGPMDNSPGQTALHNHAAWLLALVREAAPDAARSLLASLAGCQAEPEHKDL